jgi:hypothetical protein
MATTDSQSEPSVPYAGLWADGSRPEIRADVAHERLSALRTPARSEPRGRGGRGEDGMAGWPAPGASAVGAGAGKVASPRLRPRTDYRRVATQLFVRGWLLEGESVIDEEPP